MDSLACKEWAHRIVLNLKDFLITLYVPNLSKRYEFVLISNNWKQWLSAETEKSPETDISFC
jgi:hypothetical protein